MNHPTLQAEHVSIPVGEVVLNGDLVAPGNSVALIVFAHGSGSSRRSPRNQAVAQTLQRNGLATLLFDLLTEREEELDDANGRLRFDIPFLTGRLVDVIEWTRRHERWRDMPLGLFGASTGAAAALAAAARLPGRVMAVVSRGGRPDLAEALLPEVKSPTLLIAGGRDTPVVALNREARAVMKCETALLIIPGATHLFEEPGALTMVAQTASEWFLKHLPNSVGA